MSGLRTAYSWPNVDETNNSFIYSTDSGNTWKTIKLATGAYELESINGAIQVALKRAGDWDGEKQTHHISINPNLATLRAVIEITHSGYQIDIGNSTLRTILGWSTGAAVLKQGRHEATNIVQITPVNEVIIHCDSVNGSYTACNGVARQGYVLGSFFPSVPPGFKIDYVVRNLNWLRVSIPEITRMRIWITDQDDRPINLRGELLTVSCLVRDVSA